MKVTIVQATVKPTKEENMNHLERLLQENQNVDVIVLGEMCLSPYDNQSFKKNAICEHDSYFQRFQQIARKQHAYLVAGSVPEYDQGHLYNTTFIFDRNGKQIATYRKIHLFSIAYPDGTSYNEADCISPGHKIAHFDTEFGRIGVMICFDIRFPFLADRLRKEQVKCIVVPAAFNTYTGPKHWELLFRCRAVDNQLFMIGVSPSGTSVGEYNYYGHSIVVNPMGDILFEATAKEVVMTISVDVNQVENIRKNFPIISDEKVL